MLYFKHSELVNNYHVSLKTVHNWIDAAKQGKLELKLVEKGSRVYVANNPGNVLELEKLATQGKKFRNVRFNKVVTPTPEFYDVFSRRQILDIISNLTIHHEIPFQYSYLDGGATNWDAWINRLANDGGRDIYNASLELLGMNFEAVDRLIAGRKRVNVVDIGPGNGYPVKGLLTHLQKQGLLNRYIAIDISKAMLDIAEKNIKDWLGEDVAFEGYVRDIGYERFDDVIVDDMLGNDADDIVNLALFLGGTGTNFRSPVEVLENIYESMSKDDLLIYTGKVDAESTRRYFDFNLDSGSTQISPLFRFVLDMIGIEPDVYKPEFGYDERKRLRYIRVRLLASVTVAFEFSTSKRSIDLAKGETILLLRMGNRTTAEMIRRFDKVGFTLLQASTTQSRETLLTILGVEARTDILVR